MKIYYLLLANICANISFISVLIARRNLVQLLRCLVSALELREIVFEFGLVFDELETLSLK
jgi:hypothetical protein